eukprot:3337445-Pleurochrysis_carterae.AAC.5
MVRNGVAACCFTHIQKDAHARQAQLQLPLDHGDLGYVQKVNTSPKPSSDQHAYHPEQLLGTMMSCLAPTSFASSPQHQFPQLLSSPPPTPPLPCWS